MSARRLHRAMAKVLNLMSPLQREITNALIAGEDPGYDEIIAERHGTTSGAIRIERDQARRIVQEAIGTEIARNW